MLVGKQVGRQEGGMQMHLGWARRVVGSQTGG